MTEWLEEGVVICDSGAYQRDPLLFFFFFFLSAVSAGGHVLPLP